MARFYDIDEANATLGELESIATVLAEQRAELVRLRDHALARSPGTGDDVEPLSDDELRTLRLRMQGLVDQMAAGVARIDQLGLSLRDIESGLVDFPALVSGRQVWLCWRRGEAQIGWWHDLDTGFSSRRPLSEMA
jgi:hypothetical protein